jgi:HK97 family phage major capsid protein
MSTYTKKLREDRANIWEGIKADLDIAAAESRSLTAEEDAKFAAASADLDAIDERIKSLEGAELRAVEHDQRLAEIESRAGIKAIADPPTEDDAAARVRAFCRGEIRSMEFEMRDIAPLNTLGTTDGGDLVPVSFINRLTDYMRENSGVLRTNPTQITSATGGNTLEIPIITGVSSAVITAEKNPFTESEPTFSKYQMGAYKYGLMMYLTREMVEDSGVDLLGFLAKQAGQALGNAFGKDLLDGGGTTEPWGVLTQSTKGVDGADATAGAITADNLIDLYYSVIEPYRNSSSCYWLMRDATIGAIRKLKNTVDGTYLFQPSLVAGTPDQLLGKPIVTDPNMPGIAVDVKSVMFGDFSSYWVRTVGGIRFDRDDSVGFANDVITYRAAMRGDGVLVDRTGAVKHFLAGAVS